jgi:hypothetical protein
MKKNIFLLLIFLLILSCNGLFRKVDSRKVSPNAQERAKQNLEQGSGISLKNLGKSIGRGGAYEFSTSNPMWRASLEILDFLPLSTVDYSGGVIITDWYNDSNSADNSSIKITVRFLSNEIQTNSFKVIVHQRECKINNCTVKAIDSKIREELTRSILTKAATIQAEAKNKK